MSTFSGARNFTLNNPTLIDNSSSQVIHSQVVHQGRKSRLKALLKASMPDAFHDSSARDPPPKCHPGTREGFIETITQWGRGSGECTQRILWMRGPAGVGKSALAQSCAETLGDELGAAFFFSEFNNRRDPNRLFPSIAYQLAVKIHAYGDIVDEKTRHNPNIFNKTRKHQFRELIVDPLKELAARGQEVGELVIIVDGLDECAGHDAQCNIVGIVAESVRDQATPFLWAFFSRPEVHITTAFTSPLTSPLSFRLELPVSDRTDAEIGIYLRDTLGQIGRECGLPVSWPSEDDLQTLVKRSAGLFVYAATVTRFIGDRNSLAGPADQLQFVLTLRRPVIGDSKHPLSELDSFYTLIVRRIPPSTLPTTLKVLLATTFPLIRDSIIENANLLGLTELQFQNACRGLHSVLELVNHGIQFFHASFMEFLQDPERSGDLCIYSNCAVALRSELLDKLNRIHATSNSHKSINIPMTWPRGSKRMAYQFMVVALFYLCQQIALDIQALHALGSFDFGKLAQLICNGDYSYFAGEVFDPNLLRQKIPKEYQRNIIRPYNHLYLFHSGIYQKPGSATWDQPYILGHGKNKVLCWSWNGGGSIVGPYPTYYSAAIVKWWKYRRGQKKEDVDEDDASDASDTSYLPPN